MPSTKEAGGYPKEFNLDGEIKRLLAEGRIEKVTSCTDDQFISLIVITVKRHQSVKLALDARQLSKFIHRKKYQMPNIEELLVSIAQLITDTTGTVWFTSLDLKYAYGQITLSPETSLLCNFCLVGGAATGTYRFQTSFYGLGNMPAEFQQALDMLLNQHPAAHAFLDDVLIVSSGTRADHLAKVDAVLATLNAANVGLNQKKGQFAVNQIHWLGYDISPSRIKPVTQTTRYH